MKAWIILSIQILLILLAVLISVIWIILPKLNSNLFYILIGINLFLILVVFIWYIYLMYKRTQVSLDKISSDEMKLVLAGMDDYPLVQNNNLYKKTMNNSLELIKKLNNYQKLYLDRSSELRSQINDSLSMSISNRLKEEYKITSLLVDKISDLLVNLRNENKKLELNLMNKEEISFHNKWVNGLSQGIDDIITDYDKKIQNIVQKHLKYEDKLNNYFEVVKNQALYRYKSYDEYIKSYKINLDFINENISKIKEEIDKISNDEKKYLEINLDYLIKKQKLTQGIIEDLLKYKILDKNLLDSLIKKWNNNDYMSRESYLNEYNIEIIKVIENKNETLTKYISTFT